MTIKMVSVAVIVCMQLAFDVTNHFPKSDCLVYKLLVSLAFTSKSYQVTLPPTHPPPGTCLRGGGGDVPLSLPNPDPVSDVSNFHYHFSDLASKIHTCFQSKMAKKP